METYSFDGLTLYFDSEEREAADLIRAACEKTVQLARSLWGLGVPHGCRVYMMTSWLRFAFHASPWPRKVLLALFMPFWAIRARKVWVFSGGWTLSYQKPPVAGIKPPWLMEKADKTMGRQIFVLETDMNVKTQHVTCHELTHALTGHLRLPAWLHEGIAMLTVDVFHGQPTVQPQTLEVLARVQHKTSPTDYQKLRYTDQHAVIYLTVRGYWITRYFAETHPDALKAVLSRRHQPDELLQVLSTALEIEPESFWQQIDDRVITYFNNPKKESS